jgi:hypothetical protein
MKIYQLMHRAGVGSIIATPRNDHFVSEYLRKFPDLPAEAVVPSFQLADPAKAHADFFRIDNSVLVFTKKILMSPLGQSLAYAGNIHPTTLNDTGEEIFLLNVTAEYNCLDQANTIFHTAHGDEKGVDHQMGIKTPAFFTTMIGDSSLFRLPQKRRSAIYVASRGHESSDDFYHTFHQLGLTSIEFRQVWDDEL